MPPKTVVKALTKHVIFETFCIGKTDEELRPALERFEKMDPNDPGVRWEKQRIKCLLTFRSKK